MIAVVALVFTVWHYVTHQLDGHFSFIQLRSSFGLLMVFTTYYVHLVFYRITLFNTLQADKGKTNYVAEPAAVVQDNFSLGHHSAPSPMLGRSHVDDSKVPGPGTHASMERHSTPSGDISSIHSDLLRCSRAMGMSEERMTSDSNTIGLVTQTVKQFLDAVRLVVPERSHFTRHKNPCFPSNVTIGNHLTQILLTYLRPEFSKGLKELEKVYSREQVLKMVVHRKSLMCLPFFYVAGFPKCATTSLHKALQEHPQIVAPINKEPHWWTRVNDLSSNSNLPRDYAMFYVWLYIIFFKQANEKIAGESGDDIITYDGSQSLLWDSNFFQHGQDYCAMPAVLSRVQPKAKFIVVMRDPTARLYSHFFWSFKHYFGGIDKWPAYVKQNASDTFHSEVVLVIKTFRNCLKSSSLFECASGFKSLTKKESAGRIGHKFYIGLYYVHIKKWLEFFPREQFLFLRMEDMVANFTAAMAEIMDFLELKEVAHGEMESWLTKANAQVALSEKYLMQTETKALLDEAYGPYNQLLASLLGSERYLWSNR